MICPRCHREYEPEDTECAFDGAALVSTPRVELIGSQKSQETGAIWADRYAVRGLVGKGGMARVYLAEDQKTGEAVAVKVLSAAYARDSVARERFLREAKAAAAIGHPNVVKIRDFGKRSDDVPFLVMEYLFGESLGDFIKREAPLGLDIALPILEQVAAALDAAHQVKILHRDVKPDNIFLVGEPGEPYAVKVVDFGLAKIREGALTAAGTVVGTVEYMAPEQCVADPADRRTDVFGLGMVAYKMLTGGLPFKRKKTEEVLASNFLLDVPALQATRDDVAQVVATALRKNPDNRYTSMADFRRDLLTLLGDHDGPLLAAGRPALADIYLPRSPFAENVAKVYYRALDLPIPATLGAAQRKPGW